MYRVRARIVREDERGRRRGVAEGFVRLRGVSFGAFEHGVVVAAPRRSEDAEFVFGARGGDCFARRFFLLGYEVVELRRRPGRQVDGEVPFLFDGEDASIRTGVARDGPRGVRDAEADLAERRDV